MPSGLAELLTKSLQIKALGGYRLPNHEAKERSDAYLNLALRCEVSHSSDD
jgi:hypothetical protein